MLRVISFDLHGGFNRVLLPAGAQIIKLTLKKYMTNGFDKDYVIREIEAGVLVGWAVIHSLTTPATTVERVLIVAGTDRPVPPSAVYVDSVIFEDPKMAFHLFEVKP